VSGQFHAPVDLSPIRIGQEVRWAPDLIWTQWRRERNHMTAPLATEPQSSTPWPSHYAD